MGAACRRLAYLSTALRLFLMACADAYPVARLWGLEFRRRLAEYLFCVLVWRCRRWCTGGLPASPASTSDAGATSSAVFRCVGSASSLSYTRACKYLQKMRRRMQSLGDPLASLTRSVSLQTCSGVRLSVGLLVAVVSYSTHGPPSIPQECPPWAPVFRSVVLVCCKCKNVAALASILFSR